MIRYVLFTLLLLISISIFSQPIYDRLELGASPYYTYFYDLNGDNKKDAIEFSDEINIFSSEARSSFVTVEERRSTGSIASGLFSIFLPLTNIVPEAE